MGLLAAGAGAADGLQNYMLEQLKQRIEAETERHNQADESLQGRQIDENAATRNLTAQSQADLRAQQVLAAKRGEQDDTERKAQEDAILNDPNAPDIQKQYIKLRRAIPKGENLPYEIFTQPNGPKGTPGPIEDTPQGLMRIGPDSKPEPITGPDGKPLQRYHAPVAPSLAQDDAGFFLIPRTGANAGQASPVQGPGGGQLQPKSPATVLNRQDMAGKIATHFDDAQAEVEDADKRGLLGPLAGRTMSDFLLNGAGSTGNSENDKLLNALQMDLSLLSTGVASIHGRGQGANAGIARDLKNMMDQGKMSKDAILGALSKMREWTTTYAMPTQHGGAAAPAAGSTSDPLGLFTK